MAPGTISIGAPAVSALSIAPAPAVGDRQARVSPLPSWDPSHRLRLNRGVPPSRAS
jgi:hypothetical protein